MIRVVLSALLLLALLPLNGQQLRPLNANDRLAPPAKGSVAAELQKAMPCGEPVELPGITRVIVGERALLRIDLDTAGLGSNLEDIRCTGCDEAAFGTVRMRNDTVTYDPLPGVVQGFDTLTFTVCAAGGQVCSEPTRIIILAQRPGRTIDLERRTVGPEEAIEILVPDADLASPLTCRSLE